MESFALHPELFEIRNDVLEMLADAGFAWLADFSSVDLLHDVYGVEVCGVREEADARAIQKLLRSMFPAWAYSRLYHKGGHTREPGWKILINRDPEVFLDNWRRGREES